MEHALRDLLIGAGASVVGFASVEEGLCEEFRHLGRAISIGMHGNLRENNLELLGSLQKLAARHLRRQGYRFFTIPPDSDRIKDTFASKLYPLFTHKMAATCAGIGWVGRNGLLISPRYGPKLSLATVLTDAPLVAADPVDRSSCGECRLCVEHCPVQALTGAAWSRSDPFPVLVDTDRCRTRKGETKRLNGKPNCGLCINICPYGRPRYNDTGIYMEEHR